MGSDRGDSFSFDFELNENPFSSKSKGKLSPRSCPIQCERKWKHSFLSVNAIFKQSNFSLIDAGLHDNYTLRKLYFHFLSH